MPAYQSISGYIAVIKYIGCWESCGCWTDLLALNDTTNQIHDFDNVTAYLILIQIFTVICYILIVFTTHNN